MIIRSIRSPDGLLTLLVERLSNGDVLIGFEGNPWHIHIESILGRYGKTPEAAIHNYIEKIINNNLTICIRLEDNVIKDTWVSSDPVSDALGWPSGTYVLTRKWDSL